MNCEITSRSEPLIPGNNVTYFYQLLKPSTVIRPLGKFGMNNKKNS